jgi:hypothetical protein
MLTNKWCVREIRSTSGSKRLRFTRVSCSSKNYLMKTEPCRQKFPWKTNQKYYLTDMYILSQPPRIRSQRFHVTRVKSECPVPDSIIVLCVSFVSQMQITVFRIVTIVYGFDLSIVLSTWDGTRVFMCGRRSVSCKHAIPLFTSTCKHALLIVS